MKIIEKLVDRMHEELEDAETYVDLALLYKDERRSLSETFVRISEQEVSHYDMLHKEAVRIITEYREKNGEPPAAMLAVYEYQHKKAIEEMAEVKMKLEMAKG